MGIVNFLVVSPFISFALGRAVVAALTLSRTREKCRLPRSVDFQPSKAVVCIGEREKKRKERAVKPAWSSGEDVDIILYAPFIFATNNSPPP